MSKKLAEIDWLQLMIEGFVVLFGVMAAFLITEWRQGVEGKKAVIQGQARLNEEILDTYQSMKIFEQDVSQRLEKLINLESEIDGSLAMKDYFKHFTGFRVTEIYDATWSRINRVNIVEGFKPEYYEDAANLYLHLSYIEKYNLELYGLNLNPIIYQPEQAKVAYQVCLSLMKHHLMFVRDSLGDHKRFLEKYAPDLLLQKAE